MLIMRGTVAAVVIFIHAFQGVASDDSPFSLVNKQGFCLVGSSSRCSDVRWTTNNRLFVPRIRKCLGVQGKTLGSSVSLYDCDENSDLQKWECKNRTLLALQNTDLYINLTGHESVLTNVVGPSSHLTINGGSEGACSRTYRELFTIDGNAFGMPCMFPFFYKDKWYSDCTAFDSSVKRLWCAVETKYDHELWGYCPSTSTVNWKKHPVSGVSYQVNRQSALSWFQAQTSCKQQGASLLSITDPHEQAYVTALLGSEHYILWTGLNLNPDHGWGWADGKPFRYLQWDSDNPLPDPGHACALIDSGVQSNWKSAVCGKKLGYICQKGGSVPRPTEVETGHCSRPWIPYNGECFHLYREMKTWSGAQIDCRKEGGDLASVHNIEDHSFIISQLGYASSDELWIGLNDRKTERLFDWTDHSTVTYTSWQFGEPSTSGDTEDCVLMRGEKGNWADRSCEEKHGFICSKPSATNPTEDEEVLDVGCKPGWKKHGSYCYLVGSVTKTFDEAKAECMSSSSYLVDVSNGVDNAFLISLVGMRPEKYFWLGLSNQRNIDSFEWSNGASVRFTHWNALMPAHQQGCVAMLTGIFSGLWDVLPCTNKEKYICKQLAEGSVLTAPPPTQALPSCPLGWRPMAPTRPFCFKFFTGPRSGEKTWYEAKDYCKAIGGDLLSLHSSSDITVSHGKAWIGLNTPDQTTGYVWTDESPVNFLHWENGEPNNLNNMESCVEIKMSQWDEDGSWNDVHCESYNDWLCQIRLGVDPKPPPPDPAKDHNQTEDGWLVWRGNQYYINGVPMAMEDARHYCKQQHADLVIINSEVEAVFLWKQVARSHGQFYIGLTADLDGSYEWLDESPAVFTRWGENQPDFLNSDENCVVFNHYNGFWNDLNCGTEQRSICKRSASPPANTTVAPTVAPTGGCPPEWTKFGSKCYQIVQRRTETWTDARKRCQSKGGNLVSIMSRSEQAFLVIQMATAAAPDLWIGLNSLRGDEFYWTDGRPRKYSNRGTSASHRQIIHFLRRWSEDQCAVLNSNADQGFGKWMLKSCNDTNGYVCMRNVDQRFQVLPGPLTPDHYVQLGNDSIKILTQNVTWDQAKKLCEAEGAQLASIRNDWSQAYVELQALNLNTPLWIGLNTNQTGGYFRFIDGWHLFTTNWARNEPSRGQPCVYVDVDGKWKTAPCNQNMNSVCMKTTEVPPPTEPGLHPGVCPDHTTRARDHSYFMTPDSDETVAWVPFRDHCYLFMTDEVDWADAASSCVRLGATLASIGDPVEQRFIKSKVEKLKDSHSAFWIGLYKTHKGLWLWLDKTPMDYVNWARYEPDDDTYGTVHSDDGLWRTGHRWHTRAYICETPKEITEQLPTAASRKQVITHPRHRIHSAVAAVLVVSVLSVLAATAFLLYKKSGRPMPTFDNPLYFNRERSQPDVIDTNKLIEKAEKAEVENPEPMITL